MTVNTENNKQESQENTISPVPAAASLREAIEQDGVPAGAGCAGRTKTGSDARQESKKEERMIVRKTRSHYYNISTRTRPVKRELRARAVGRGKAVRIGKGKECGVS
ncbi:MAG: hypothetical protein OS112_09065 [Methanoregula sp.]|nr:MAG: hypothetical protein OS112_09065 [Methanoregula sp.]